MAFATNHPMPPVGRISDSVIRRIEAASDGGGSVSADYAAANPPYVSCLRSAEEGI